MWGLVADEYEKAADGAYRLTRASTPLQALLARVPGLRVCRAHDASAALAAARASPPARSPRQSTNEVLMVAPAAFGFNPQAAQDNFFMSDKTEAAPSSSSPSSRPETVTEAALREHAGLVRALTEEAGVRVTLLEHAPAHDTPDAVFPNNWFSTHAAGEAGGGVKDRTLVYYPLKCPNRAAERRADARAVLEGRWEGGRSRILDLSPAEKGGPPAPFPPTPAFFEGTGVLVLDRVNGVAYVCLSERADAGLAAAWAEAVGYKEVVTFNSHDARDARIYHTNVMMAVGSGVAVVCLASVRDAKERERLKSALARHHKVVDISLSQVDEMCGNVLEVEDGCGLPALAMSTRAWRAFGEEGRKALLRGGVASLVHAPFDTIEMVGGGGVRCALGELF